MSIVNGARNIYERHNLISTEVDDLRAENQKLYRLVLELVWDLHDLEQLLGECSSLLQSRNRLVQRYLDKQ
jgi:hypothetical protein